MDRKAVFCTLFDSNYIASGLALYDSLEKVCTNFHLYIFAFDDISFKTLKRYKLKFATIISLSDFEDTELLKVKNERTKGEYCWTSTSSTIIYVLNNYNEEQCTYLDSDIYFFSSPSVLLEENDNSILITDHLYTKKYDQSKISGKYCVQFIKFKNDKNGLEALSWWRGKCLDWCYNRYEDGKFGDQKYLDDWVDRFDNVHVLNHQGGGAAPWNIQQFNIEIKDKQTLLRNKKTDKLSHLVFYHFHSLKYIEENKVDLGKYELSNDVITIIYKPYIENLNKIRKELSNKNFILKFSNRVTVSKKNRYKDYFLQLKTRSYREIVSAVYRKIIAKKNIYLIGDK